MAVHLVVIHDFEDYSRGDRIEDPDVIARIIEAGHAHKVVRVLAADKTEGS